MPDVKCPRGGRGEGPGAGLSGWAPCGDDRRPRLRRPLQPPPPTGGRQALEMWPVRLKDGIFSLTYFNLFKVKCKGPPVASHDRSARFQPAGARRPRVRRGPRLTPAAPSPCPAGARRTQGFFALPPSVSFPCVPSATLPDLPHQGLGDVNGRMDSNGERQEIIDNNLRP